MKLTVKLHCSGADKAAIPCKSLPLLEVFVKFPPEAESARSKAHRTLCLLDTVRCDVSCCRKWRASPHPSPVTEIHKMSRVTAAILKLAKATQSYHVVGDLYASCQLALAVLFSANWC